MMATGPKAQDEWFKSKEIQRFPLDNNWSLDLPILIQVCAISALTRVHWIIVWQCATPGPVPHPYWRPIPPPWPPHPPSHYTPPLFPYPLLAGVHITCPDLLPVLAAGQLGNLKPQLHCHEPFLNASSTQLGAFCPTWPRPHFAP